MAVWGLGVINNVINWGRGAFNNLINWGILQKNSPAGDTEIYGLRQDTDTTAFLTATGITDATISSAVDALVVDLKAYGIWSKMKAVYPFVGGTATTHKFNLVNPADTDAAFRLSFLGGWTHSSNGSTPNGTNGYANTFFNPSVSLSLNNASLGFYGGTDFSFSNKAAMGCILISPFRCFEIYPVYTGIGLIGDVNDASTGSTPNNNAKGLILASRLSSTSKLHSIRGVNTNVTSTSTTIPNSLLVIGARRNGATIEDYSQFQHRFAFLGDGLTDTEASNLYIAVQKFQSTLNRQV